jgi:hypothetical protein
MIDLKQLDDSIKDVISNLVSLEGDLFSASETVIALQSEIDENETRLICQGVEGKNEAERKANLKACFSDLRLELEKAEKSERRVKAALKLQQILLDGLRYRLRIAELMKESEK